MQSKECRLPLPIEHAVSNVTYFVCGDYMEERKEKTDLDRRLIWETAEQTHFPYGPVISALRRTLVQAKEIKTKNPDNYKKAEALFTNVEEITARRLLTEIFLVRDLTDKNPLLAERMFTEMHVDNEMVRTISPMQVIAALLTNKLQLPVLS